MHYKAIAVDAAEFVVGLFVAILSGVLVVALIVAMISLFWSISGLSEAHQASSEKYQVECQQKGGTVRLNSSNKYAGCLIGPIR